MPSTLTPFVFVGAIALMMVWMNYSGKKARQRAADERNALIKIGARVMTTAGFYGTIVDIDGDAITLASPSGDETVWDRKAIARAAEIPLAETSGWEGDETDEEAQTEDATEGDSTPDSNSGPASPFSSK